MNDRKQQLIANWMNMLPIVKWDRMLETKRAITVYGWIDRPDGRSDFVSLRFAQPVVMTVQPELVTSSAYHSMRLHKCLRMEPHDCKRISDEFGDSVHHKVPTGYGIPPSMPNPDA